MKNFILKIICLVLSLTFVLTGCRKSDNGDAVEGSYNSDDQNLVESGFLISTISDTTESSSQGFSSNIQASAESSSQSGSSNTQGLDKGNNITISSAITRTNYKFKNACFSSDSTSVRVDFGVINNCNLYAPGDEIKYFIDLSGNALNGKTVKVSFYNKNFGVNKTFEHTISTNSSGTQSINGVISTESTYKNGIYTLDCTIGDVITDTLEFDIGIVPRAARASNDFYYGVQPYITKCTDTSTSHKLNHQDAENTIISKFSTIDYMGCNIIREEITNFGGMWTSANKIIDSAVNKNIVETADKLGITYLWLATGSPAWAIDSKYTDSEYQSWQLPPDADVWKKYINTIGKYYKDYNNIIFEIWNEADWKFFQGTKEEYFNLLDIAVNELTSVSNRIRILPSACVSEWEISQNSAAYSKGRSDYFSYYLKYINNSSLLGLNFHDHQLFNQKLINDYKKTADSALSDVMNLGYTEEQFKNKWVTESGVNGKSGSELHRAQTLTNKMLFYRATGAKSFITWEFSPNAGKSSNWAIFSDTLEPQVGVIAWTHQVGLLGNAKLKQHITAPSGYAFADIYYDGEKTIVPFYSYADGTDYMIVNGVHKVYDMYGNEMSATGDYEGSKSCIYIVFDGEVNATVFALEAL